MIQIIFCSHQPPYFYTMTNKPPILTVKIIGIGQTRIKVFEKVLCLLATKNGMSLHIQHIDSLEGILSYELHSIPAIAIDDRVVFEYAGEDEAAIYATLSEKLSFYFPRPTSSPPHSG